MGRKAVSISGFGATGRMNFDFYLLSHKMHLRRNEPRKRKESSFSKIWHRKLMTLEKANYCVSRTQEGPWQREWLAFVKI